MQIMSIIFRKDGVELLLVRPLEFRRVYSLEIEEGFNRMRYSHTDVVVELDNGTRSMLEIIQGLLPDGSYMVKTMPTDVTFDFQLSTRTESMKRLKSIIFMTFPDLTTKNMYLNIDLVVNQEM